jgi:hypothetical protein
MKILVDYDNVPPQIKRQGPIYVIDRVVSAMKAVVTRLNISQLEFRLYGGWYENQTMSRRAQEISTILRAKFPKVMISERTDPATSLRISAVLAQSLEALPGTVLTNTLRSVPVQKEFDCTKPSKIGCRNEHCPIDPLSDFLSSGACPTSGCAFTPMAVLRKMEQKLVDTMMVADMIYLAQREVAVGIVSSDDDMWPGIISALVAGTALIHVQTNGIKRVLPYYRNIGGKYQQVKI